MSRSCATAHTADVDQNVFPQQDLAVTDMSRHVHWYLTLSSYSICSEPQQNTLQGKMATAARLW